ncbi:sucrose-6-phosphate hydrolase [Alkalicoccus chagannorensis]|uniref:sucrose-6-phosphate hydrolase n=1 Tax=Alkalicoccus chagannorensis TaxID=427072 RepID=UPI0003FF3AF3|nr:sucrose-6-phosphate hydrolase [Alkalicoccus chagannorensis]
MTDREQELRRLAAESTAEKKDLAASDPHRQRYHQMPTAGLLNDPNGWVQWKGTYHLFFQWNPFQPDHSQKFWGHWTSKDLVHWTEHEPALVPSEWYEKNGCYSGSGFEKDGKLHLLYTGNVKDAEGNRESYQCLAVSTDGRTFEKQGPVVNTLPAGYTAHFRDPKVWEEDGTYYFVIGAQTEQETGQVLLYRSEDAHTWTFAGPLAGSHLNGLGAFGYMWECPDAFHLNGTDVLVVSPQGLDSEGNRFQNVYQAGYFLGTIDKEMPSFDHGAFHELDEGFDFYAPQTTEDELGRRILVGWMGVPDSDEAYQPTVAYEWVHCMTIPRELQVTNGRLIQRPVDELKTLRSGDPLEMRMQLSFGQEIAVTPAAEIDIDCSAANRIELELRSEMTLSWDKDTGELTLQRPSFRDGSTETRSCTVPELHHLQLFLDHSSVEVFVNGGEAVLTSRYFPHPQHNVVAAGGDGTVVWTSWELRKEE